MDGPVQVSWVVEEDEDAAPRHSRETLTRAYFGAVVTLSLGVLGSTVLPVPFAVSRVGLLTGMLTMLVVAWANDVTSCLLVRSSAYTGLDTYEALAHWAGGRKWKIVTEVSLLVLLFGTMCGGISLMADLGVHIAQLALGQTDLAAAGAAGAAGAGGAGAAALPTTAALFTRTGGMLQLPCCATNSSTMMPELTAPAQLPAAAAPLASDDIVSILLSGPAICLMAVLLVLLPMCLLRYIRQLEGAATCGVAMVLALVALLGYDAASAGFPAIKDGSLAIWSIKVDEHLPEAFTIIGFAFYMQPMMMPLVAEMPPGPQGTAAMRAAVHTSLYGVAMAVYGTIGAFGASLFGLQTAGNIMVNPIIVGRAAGLGLYVGMLVYLALAMTTTHYALRKSLDAALFGADAPFTLVRHVALTALILSASSAVALCFPGAAAEIFNLTGATAVCVVCYIIPVYIHFRVLDSERLRAAGGSVSSAGGDLAPAGSQPQAADALTEPLLVAEAGEADALSRQALHQAVVQRQTKQGEKAGAAGRCCGGALGWLHDVCVPIAVLLLGMGCSAAALYVAIRDYVHAHQL